MARKKKTDNETMAVESKSLEERIQTLLNSRQQMQQGLLKIEGALEVLSGMLEEEKKSGKKE
tara:strand:- start:77 stop:262 length:186 start_codon:yes stop_codon:yes gene_type:complete